MILACPVLRSSLGPGKLQVTACGRDFRHPQHQSQRHGRRSCPNRTGHVSPQVSGSGRISGTHRPT